MINISSKKGMNYYIVIFLLFVVIIGSGVAIYYGYKNMSDKIVKFSEVGVTDPSFSASNETFFVDDDGNATLSVTRNGGNENYVGFQIFLEDSYGNVQMENVYITLQQGETKQINLVLRPVLLNVKYVTIVPIKRDANGREHT